jgi:hypothetical protein
VTHGARFANVLLEALACTSAPADAQTIASAP